MIRQRQDFTDNIFATLANATKECDILMAIAKHKNCGDSPSQVVFRIMADEEMDTPEAYEILRICLQNPNASRHILNPLNDRWPQLRLRDYSYKLAAIALRHPNSRSNGNTAWMFYDELKGDDCNFSNRFLLFVSEYLSLGSADLPGLSMRPIDRGILNDVRATFRKLGTTSSFEYKLMADNAQSFTPEKEGYSHAVLLKKTETKYHLKGRVLSAFIANPMVSLDDALHVLNAQIVSVEDQRGFSPFANVEEYLWKVLACKPWDSVVVDFVTKLKVDTHRWGWFDYVATNPNLDAAQLKLVYENCGERGRLYIVEKHPNIDIPFFRLLMGENSQKQPGVEREVFAKAAAKRLAELEA